MNIIGKVKFKSVAPLEKIQHVFFPGSYWVTSPDGKKFLFDWSAHHSRCSREDGYTVFESLMEDFDYVFFENSFKDGVAAIKREDLTPEFLVSCSLDYAHCECATIEDDVDIPTELVSFTFKDYDDLSGKEYSFSPEQIEKANLVIRKLEEAN